MAEGVDALGHPDPAALVKAGKRFIGQYLKSLSSRDVQGYHAIDIDVVLIGESITGKRSLLGHDAGVADAHTYLAQANALGAPDTVAIYLAEVDFDASSGQLPVIQSYYHGAQTVLGKRTGGYGGYRAIKALFDATAITYGMQTYAWSGGKWDSRAQIQQYLNGQSLGGTGVDFDRATVSDFGAWEANSMDETSIATKVRDILANDSTFLAHVANSVWGSGGGQPTNYRQQLVDAIKVVLPAAGPVDPAAVADAVAVELARRLSAT